MEEKEQQIKELLKACGMRAFVDYLFPALSKDINLTVLEMSRICPEYNGFSANAQNTRLSKARTIFKNGWEYDALEIIAKSSRVPVDVRLKARELIDKA